MAQPAAATAIDQLAEALGHHRAGRHAAAEAGYRAVLAEAADHPRALHLLGLLLLEAGRPAQARDVLRRASLLRPDQTDTRLALARACAESGVAGEAVALLQSVLEDRPCDVAVMLALVRLLSRQGEHPAALALCARALAAAPDAARTHAALAGALVRSGQKAAALAAADAALRIDPALSDAWLARGVALRALGQAEDAEAVLAQAARLAPGDAEIALAHGNALADCGRLEAAATLLRHAVTLQPALPEAHASLAAVLTAHGDLPAAVAACDRAIEYAPAFAPAYWNRAVAHLLAGDFAAGWRDAEWRKRHPSFAADFAGLAGPEWTGGPLAGLRLLVHAGQGMGDTIHFARYLPLLAAEGAQVVLACAAALVPLLSRIPGITVVPRAAGLPAHDAWVDQMSLPLLLATRAGRSPAPYPTEPYLQAEPHRVATWRRGIGAAIRVGLAWAGNPAHANDRRRSLPLGQTAILLAPLHRLSAAVPRLRFVGLQAGPRHSELAEAFGMADIPADLVDFAETAAVVETLDLVITVDTAVAHLAGALGKPVWLMLPHAPDWRWQLGRTDSPWYPSMRLFRQPAPGDWASVVRAVAGALRARYAARVNHWAASMPAVADVAVSTQPHAMSTTVTVTDQPRRVERLVRSYVP